MTQEQQQHTITYHKSVSQQKYENQSKTENLTCKPDFFLKDLYMYLFIGLTCCYLAYLAGNAVPFRYYGCLASYLSDEYLSCSAGIDNLFN